MKTPTLTILMVMLSLAAAALVVADADADVDVIRLPSDGGEGLVADQAAAAAAEAAEKERADEDAAAAAAVEAAEKERAYEDAAAAAQKDAVGEETPRPWACCNQTVCTKSFPPMCRCLDIVDRCAATCQECKPSTVDPLRHACNDQYHGDPGPTCAKDDDFPGGASRSIAAPARVLLAFIALLIIYSR